MARNEPPSALLIISAIDLLLASLVCAVVLFVALVGARGHASDEQTGKGSQAPIPITILYRSDPLLSDAARPVEVDVLNARRIGDPQEANAADAEYSGFKFNFITRRTTITTRLFGSSVHIGETSERDSYRWLSFSVKPGAREVTITDIPTVAYAAIHLGTRGSYYLWMRCHEPGWRLRLALETFRVLEDTCKNRHNEQNERPTVMPPKPFVVVTNQAPPPADWNFISQLPEGAGIVSRWTGKSTDIPVDVSTAVFTY